MRRRTTFWHVVTSVWAGGLAVLLVLPSHAARLPGEYMNEMWTGYETPHIPWAKPYSGGRIRAFFIAPYTAAREVAELAQRLDLEVAGESTASDRSLGALDEWNAQVTGTSPSEKKQALTRKLQQKYDVIVIANFDFSLLPVEVQYRIAEQVTEGCGLVLVYRRNVRQEFFRHPDEGGRRFITSGIPFGGIDFYPDVFMPSAKLTSPDEIPNKLVGAYRAKQGRVVQIDFGIQSDASYGGFCLTPREYFTFRSQAQYEYHQMLVVNAVVWAAKREPHVEIETPQLCRAPVELQSLPNHVPLSIKSRSAGAAAIVVSIRNVWGEVEFKKEVKAQLKTGANTVPIPIPLLCGGGHYLDVRVVGDRGSLGWASFWLEVQSAVRITEVKMDKLSFERTEPATGAVTFNAPCPANCAVEVNLLDNYQRVYAKVRVEIPAGATGVRFRVPLTNAVSIAGRCRAKLAASQKRAGAGKAAVILDQAEAEFFVPQREYDVYPTLLWGTFPGILGHWLNEQLRNAGFNTILLPHYSNPEKEYESGERRRISAISRDDFLSVPYTTHITYWGAPLGDDDAYEKARGTYLRAAQTLAPYGPYVYSLGDENYIPEDAGFKEADRPGFIAYLKREYQNLDALNRAWGTNFASWEEAAPVTLAVARQEKRWAQYHDTETYREELYARWHRWMHDVFKEVDPFARVGSEGSVPGDLEKTIAGLEFWGPYRDILDNTLLLSIAPRSLIRGNWFGGYVFQRRDLGGLRRFVWDTFLDGNNLFEVYCCYTCETIFNNDLTFAYWAKEFLPDLREVVDGIGQLQMASDHEHDPVALYHSQASLHAAAVNPPFGDWRATHIGTLTMLSEAGYQPYYITSTQVKAGRLKQPARPKVLFLPNIRALSDSEANAIGDFVTDGGVVIADVRPGVLNEHCATRETGALDAMFGWTQELSEQMARISGKGKCILLNTSMGGYTALAEEKRQSLRETVDAAIRATGVSPFCQFVHADGTPLLTSRTARFRRGKVTTLGILAPRPRSDAPKINATMLLTQPFHVYDQRTGRYYGKTAKVMLALDPTSATMLSLLPYRLEGIKASADSKVTRGSSATISVNLLATGQPEGHVVRLRVRDPKGSEPWPLARTLRPDGATATVRVPFAFNDPPGIWAVRIWDVATRIEKTLPITLVASGKEDVR